MALSDDHSLENALRGKFSYQAAKRIAPEGLTDEQYKEFLINKALEFERRIKNPEFGDKFSAAFGPMREGMSHEYYIRETKKRAEAEKWLAEELAIQNWSALNPWNAIGNTGEVMAMLFAGFVSGDAGLTENAAIAMHWRENYDVQPGDRKITLADVPDAARDFYRDHPTYGKYVSALENTDATTAFERSAAKSMEIADPPSIEPSMEDPGPLSNDAITSTPKT